jgi:hypothetical protein
LPFRKSKGKVEQTNVKRFGTTFSKGCLAPPFLKVEKVDYQDPNAPPPNTELAAIGSENASAIPGVAAPTKGVLSCVYILS